MRGETRDEQIHFTGDQHQARTPFVSLKIREWKFHRDNVAGLKWSHRRCRPASRPGKTSQCPAAASRGLRRCARSIAAYPCKAGDVPAMAASQSIGRSAEDLDWQQL